MSEFLAELRALRAAPGMVVTDPRYYFTDAGHLSLAHLGNFRIFAGVLVELWGEGALVLPCVCGGRVFIHSLAGSPLSGTHRWGGSCDACNRGVRGPRDADRVAFGELFQPVLERLGDRALAYREPQNGRAPLCAVADIARGGVGAVHLAGQRRSDRFVFEWATGTLRMPGGRAILHVDEASVSLAPGAPAWGWDGCTLRLSDGAPAFRVRRHDPRPIDQVLVAGGAADFARAPAMELETWIDSPSGEPRYRALRTGLHDRTGACVLAWSAAVPLAVAVIVAEHADLLHQLTR